MISKCFFFLVLTAIATASQVIQVPPLVNDDTVWLRLEQLATLDDVFIPFGGLKRIYNKQVYEVLDGREEDFPTCYEQAPEAAFWAASSIPIGGNEHHRGLIFDFQLVKYRRNLVDMDVYKKNIFFAREDGAIKMASYATDLQRLALTKQFQTQESKIGKGNIIILPNASNGSKKGYGVFVNHNQAVVFDLGGQTFTQMQNYTKMGDFQSAFPIQDKYFAVGYGEGGLVIYSIDFGTSSLKVEAYYNSTNLDVKSLNVKDVTYDEKRKILFVLDHNTGLFPLQLTIGKGQLQARPTSSTKANSFCNLIYYDSFTEELYLNCRELHRYRINNWPLFQQKVLPRQQISIKGITSSGGVVAFVGRNIFQVISQQRKVAVYEDKLMDKFILQEDRFFSGNENYLLMGNFKIIPPSINCQTSDLAVVGNHKLVLRVTAECNLNYFKRIGFQPGVIGNDDKCVYTVYQTVTVWQPAALNVKAFIIILSLIGVVGLGVLIWWGIGFLKLSKLRNYVEHYHSLEEERVEDRDGSRSDKKDNVMVESSPVGEGSGRKEKNELNEEIGVDSKELHDIE